jgi:putative endonuclease
MKHPCVYILASRRNGTLYVGITTDLAKRMAEHDQGIFPGFSRRYGVCQLVYYEHHVSIPEAIRREKTVKRWHPMEATADRNQEPRLDQPLQSRNRRNCFRTVRSPPQSIVAAAAHHRRWLPPHPQNVIPVKAGTQSTISGKNIASASSTADFPATGVLLKLVWVPAGSASLRTPG